MPVMVYRISKDLLDQAALKHGYQLIDFQQPIGMVSYRKNKVRVNVYLTTGTVATCIKHPKRGKTQLFRRNCTLRQIESLFINPRKHTGKGYYENPKILSFNSQKSLKTMSTQTTDRPATMIIVKNARLSFAHIWEPHQMLKNGKPEGKPKYQASLMVLKTDPQIAAIEAAIEAAKQQGKEKKKKWNNVIPNKLEISYADGDEMAADNPKYESYKGHMIIKAKSDSAPGVLKFDGGKQVPVTNKAEVYSGCYVHASINWYPYDEPKNGIAVGLQNILKAKDGPAFSGRTDAATDFAGIEDENDDL